MKLILIAFTFIVMTLSMARASCDIEVFREGILKVVQSPMEVSGGNGTAVATDIKYPENVFVVDGQSFIPVFFNVSLKLKGKKEDKIPMVMTWKVDLASCTLGQFSPDDVFGSSVKI